MGNILEVIIRQSLVRSPEWLEGIKENANDDYYGRGWCYLEKYREEADNK